MVMRKRRKLTPEQRAKMDYYWKHVWPLEEMEINRRWEFARNKIWRTKLPGDCTLLEPGAFRPECLNIYDGIERSDLSVVYLPGIEPRKRVHRSTHSETEERTHLSVTVTSSPRLR